MLPRGSSGTLAPVPRETGAFPSINARALICVDLAPSARPISDLCGHGAPVRCGRGFCLWGVCAWPRSARLGLELRPKQT